jgi:hypothetical protein
VALHAQKKNVANKSGRRGVLFVIDEYSRYQRQTSALRGSCKCPLLAKLRRPKNWWRNVGIFVVTGFKFTTLLNFYDFNKQEYKQAHPKRQKQAVRFPINPLA